MSKPFLFLGLSLLSGCVVLPPAGAQETDKQTVVGSPKTVSLIAIGSCIKQEQPMPLLEKIRLQQPDLMLFLGDNIYADTADMDVMRAKYEKLKSNADFAKLTNNTEVLAVWDDHDYGQNDAGADYPKRAESQQIFLDFWGVPKESPRRKREGTYHAKRYGPPGKRVQVILLDTRYFRSPLTQGTERRTGGPWIPNADPKLTMLGEEQWKWLEQQLQHPAELRVIASSIQCVSQDDGQETWSNLPTERKRFFDLLTTTKANGLLIVSGDRHWSELSVEPKLAPYPIYDLTSSSINQIHPRGTPTLNKYRAIPKTYHRENFGTIEIDWKKTDPTITLRIIDLNTKVQIEKTIPLSKLRPAAN